MPAPLQTWQQRTLTGAASTIVLAASGGAVLGGVWVSSKTAGGIIQAWDTASATPTLRNFVASCVSLPKGFTNIGPFECGTGLVVKVSSIKGSIAWRPASS